MRTRWTVLLAAALGACVPYPAELADDGRGSSLPSLARGTFPGLDGGASEEQTQHFTVSAYGQDSAKTDADLAESVYRRIMTDAGLYAFQPHQLYRLVIYGSRDEYRKKTGQPDWSGGVALGNSIYTFVSPRLEAVLSHQMVHVIWSDFMNGRFFPEQVWINEGLAVYEESKASGGGLTAASLRSSLMSAPMTIAQLMQLPPASERDYETSLWYAESADLVRFMIERGGSIGFSQFLNALQYGKTLDDSVVAGFPGQWRSLGDLETAWKAHLLP